MVSAMCLSEMEEIIDLQKETEAAKVAASSTSVSLLNDDGASAKVSERKRKKKRTCGSSNINTEKLAQDVEEKIEWLQGRCWGSRQHTGREEFGPESHRRHIEHVDAGKVVSAEHEL